MDEGINNPQAISIATARFKSNIDALASLRESLRYVKGYGGKISFATNMGRYLRPASVAAESEMLSLYKRDLETQIRELEASVRAEIEQLAKNVGADASAINAVEHVTIHNG